MKTIDLYIIRKFLSTFLFVTVIFILIAVVIDATEKLEDFMEKDVPFGEIFTVYYLNFVPYIAALLSPIFVFISVILFTSKMASNSEIISILGNGVSFYRMLRPYLFASLLVTGVLVYANNWLIPHANANRLAFEEKYVGHQREHFLRINLTIDKSPTSETNISMQRYNVTSNEGYQFSLETIENNQMVEQIRSPRIVYKPEEDRWEIYSYDIWEIRGDEEYTDRGEMMDTVLNLKPEDFIIRTQMKEAMNTAELEDFIEEEKRKGSQRVPFFEVEKYSRTSNAFAIVILTFIGVAFSTRKKRGGLGMNIALGFMISFVFILFIRFSTTFATNADLPPIIAVWIPNLIFGLLSLYLLKRTPK